SPLPDPIYTCTVLTTDSNELTSDLHDRMPVILTEEHWDFWLDQDLQESEPLSSLMVPFDSDEMKLEAVSTFVNNARNEGPECIEIQRELF
ncbi:MAG: SOS response-associated peptidase family protein, partial [Planctomycetota bacterium]